jgi:hypothetical protein
MAPLQKANLHQKQAQNGSVYDGLSGILVSVFFVIFISTLSNVQG